MIFLNTNIDNEEDSNNNILTNVIINQIDYKYNTNNIEQKDIISPYKEILRYIIINGLNTCFQIKFKELNNNIYNTNELFKNNNSKLNELINKWCWHQYMNNKCLDCVIPYISDETYEYDMLLYDINYILDVVNTENELNHETELIINLKITISNYLYIEYRNYIKYIDVGDNNIIKDIVDKRIKLLYNYKNNDYQITIHPKVYNRIKKRLLINSKKYNLMLNYNDDLDILLDNYIFCLIFRYSYMESGNLQLAINYNIKKLFKKIGVNFELFGSCINTISYNYCSLFYDIEKYFGSNGNFFDLEINSGIYWCNPPYDALILDKTADKLLNTLESTRNVVFLITLPIWDKYTQYKLKNDNIDNIKRNYNINSIKELHKDFNIYYLLKDYIMDEIVIPKHRIPYFNYRKYCYINAVNTYMLIVYNKNNINISDIIDLHNNFDKIIELDNINYYLKCY
jgi:hypothetical protein